MKKVSLATFGGGCFWCTEAVFENLKGVESVTSGYSGGSAETANYRSVSSGRTDHAEVIQVAFDSELIPFEVLLKVHMTTHNPTTPNQQGADIGTQYRSVVFAHDEEQRESAEAVLTEMKDVFSSPIVTKVEDFEAFYPAEDYHQSYYDQNKTNPYCQAVIDPKISKFRKQWGEWTKG